MEETENIKNINSELRGFQNDEDKITFLNNIINSGVYINAEVDINSNLSPEEIEALREKVEELQRRIEEEIEAQKIANETENVKNIRAELKGFQRDEDKINYIDNLIAGGVYNNVEADINETLTPEEIQRLEEIRDKINKEKESSEPKEPGKDESWSKGWENEERDADGTIHAHYGPQGPEKNELWSKGWEDEERDDGATSAGYSIDKDNIKQQIDDLKAQIKELRDRAENEKDPEIRQHLIDEFRKKKQELRDLREGKDPVVEQIKSADKKKEQLTIEDKKNGQFTIEDKKNGILAIEDKMMNNGPITRSTIEETGLRRTGLQIFREQFNQMPEIEAKHVLSEKNRWKLLIPAGMVVAGIASGPVGWIGGAAIAASGIAAKPILKRLTGQKDLEDAITAQFDLMDDKEFEIMTDYLTPAQIIELKPNKVILDALTRSANNRRNKLMSNRTDEYEAFKAKQEELLQKDPSTLTESEKLDLDAVTKRISELEEIAQKRADTAGYIKYGSDRKGYDYKGNITGSRRFFGIANSFVKRDSTTEEYKDKINDLADQELVMLEGERDNDVVKQAQGQAGMRKVMEENTYNKRGIQRSVFNGKEGMARVISDEKDNTIRNITIFTTVGIGLARTVQRLVQAVKTANENADIAQDMAVNNGDQRYNNIIERLKNTLNNNYKDENAFAKAADGQVTKASAMGEHAIVNENGSFNAAYRQGDAEINSFVDQLGNKSFINGSTASEKLHGLADAVDATRPMSERLASSAANAGQHVFAGVDHATNFAHEMGAVEQDEALSSILRSSGNVAKEIENIVSNPETSQTLVSTAKKIGIDWVGPIITVIGTKLGLDSKNKSEVDRQGFKDQKDFERKFSEENEEIYEPDEFNEEEIDDQNDFIEEDEEELE